MADQPGIVIVDETGTEHQFPAGFDPKRAAEIVRKQRPKPEYSLGKSEADIKQAYPELPAWWPRDRYGKPISSESHPLDEMGRPANWADRTFSPPNLEKAGIISDFLAPILGIAGGVKAGGKIPGSTAIPRALTNTGAAFERAGEAMPMSVRLPMAVTEAAGGAAFGHPQEGLMTAGATLFGPPALKFLGKTLKGAGAMMGEPPLRIGAGGEMPPSRLPLDVPKTGGPIQIPPRPVFGSQPSTPPATATASPRPTGADLMSRERMLLTLEEPQASTPAPQAAPPPLGLNIPQTGGPIRVPPPVPRPVIGGQTPSPSTLPLNVPQTGGPITGPFRPTIGGQPSSPSTLPLNPPQTGGPITTPPRPVIGGQSPTPSTLTLSPPQTGGPVTVPPRPLIGGQPPGPSTLPLNPPQTGGPLTGPPRPIIGGQPPGPSTLPTNLPFEGGGPIHVTPPTPPTPEPTLMGTLTGRKSPTQADQIRAILEEAPEPSAPSVTVTPEAPPAASDYMTQLQESLKARQAPETPPAPEMPPKVPLSELTTKSKRAQSPIPGISAEDYKLLEEVIPGVKPEQLKALAPELVDQFLKARADRAAAYRTNAGLDKGARMAAERDVTEAPAPSPAVENPYDAAGAAQELNALRDIKPRPLDKLYGKNGPTPEQRIQWEADMKEWNRKYRAASVKQKSELDKSNEWFRSQ